MAMVFGRGRNDLRAAETPPQPSPNWGGSRNFDDTLASSGNAIYATTYRQNHCSLPKLGSAPCYGTACRARVGFSGGRRKTLNQLHKHLTKQPYILALMALLLALASVLQPQRVYAAPLAQTYTYAECSRADIDAVQAEMTTLAQGVLVEGSSGLDIDALVATRRSAPSKR